MIRNAMLGRVVYLDREGNMKEIIHLTDVGGR